MRVRSLVSSMGLERIGPWSRTTVTIVCLAAAPLAAQSSPPDWFPARTIQAYDADMAYDVARQRTVVLCNTYYDWNGETWEWDGTRWHLQHPTSRPSTRVWYSVAYDAARERTVLFGGRSTLSQSLADTWEWDGRTWTERATATRPPGRYGHVLTYDIRRARLVLYGGVDTTGAPLDDTWEFDGADWALRPTTATPGYPQRMVATYDPRAAVTILVSVPPTGTLVETWQWDGVQWIRRTPVHGLMNFWPGAIADHPGRRRLVMLGFDRPTGTAHTLEWDGADWANVGGATDVEVAGSTMAYDPGRGRMLLFNPAGATMWEWDGTTWTQRTTPATPTTTRAAAMVWEDRRQKCLLFGGVGLRPVDETWEWDGYAWTPRVLATRPPPRHWHAMAHDGLRAHTVLFGGSSGGALLGDTWEWDGNAWKERTPSTAPVPRDAHAMAYDAARQRVVLFGGNDWRGGRTDTWEWDGVSWLERRPATLPPPRFGHAMAYDAGRQRIVLFGGLQSLDDTWEWDGVDWSLRPTNARPRARSWHALAYDSSRQLVVLHGGIGGGVRFNDTWVWDGTDWRVEAPARGGPPLEGASMAYDPDRRQMLLATNHGTWVYGGAPVAASVEFGNGCAGSGRVPLLDVELPYLGNDAWSLDVLRARAAAPCVVGLDATTQSLTLGGGCTLHLGLGHTVFLGATSNAFGFASTRFPIPRDLRLRGMRLYAQAAIVDPAGGALGLAWTAARRLTVGD